jgi:hypothetical protein
VAFQQTKIDDELFKTVESDVNALKIDRDERAGDGYN